MLTLQIEAQMLKWITLIQAAGPEFIISPLQCPQTILGFPQAIGLKTLLGAPGLTTRSKKPLGGKGIATRSDRMLGTSPFYSTGS